MLDKPSPVALGLLVMILWIGSRTYFAPSRVAVHEHVPGSHGGTVVSVGRENFHAEIVVDQEQTLRIYMLGADETQVIDVPQQQPTAYVRGTRVEAVAVPLEPAPQEGDAPGHTSQFVGRVPRELQGQPLHLSIPQLRIAGRRFRIAATLDAASHDSSPDHGPAMPAQVDDREATDLYLVAGGRYTEQDIEANGRQTAAAAYRGFRAAHDFDPQPGDALCPVTRTKANAQCSWVIGGQTYEFCCPPCIDEFVKLAKESPEEIEPPQAYVQPTGKGRHGPT